MISYLRYKIISFFRRINLIKTYSGWPCFVNNDIDIFLKKFGYIISINELSKLLLREEKYTIIQIAKYKYVTPGCCMGDGVCEYGFIPTYALSKKGAYKTFIKNKNWITESGGWTGLVWFGANEYIPNMLKLAYREWL
jgi:hypothetical protein